MTASLLASAGEMDVPLSLQYTWTAEAEFGSAFESDFDPWGDVEVGDELPYIPEHQLRATAGLTGEAWGFDISAAYIGRMRATAGQGAFDPADTIDSYVVWDLIGRWRWSDSVTTYVKVDNLFDETYLVTGNSAFDTAAAYVEQVYGRPREVLAMFSYGF